MRCRELRELYGKLHPEVVENYIREKRCRKLHQEDVENYIRRVWKITSQKL
jgi:hypothetical protein